MSRAAGRGPCTGGPARRGARAPAAARRSAGASRAPASRSAGWSSRGPGAPSRAARSCLGLGAGRLGLELFGLEVGPAGDDDVLDVARHPGGEVVPGHPDAVVGQPVLREVVGADLLAPVAGAHLAAAERVPLAGDALLLELVELRPEHAHRHVVVLGLALLLLALHDDAGGLVDEPDRRVGGVDALAAGPGGAHHLSLDIGLLDLHVDVLG